MTAYTEFELELLPKIKAPGSFAEALKDFMFKNGLKQKDLAELLNASQPAISSWCAGRFFPDYNALKILYSMGMDRQQMFPDAVHWETENENALFTKIYELQRENEKLKSQLEASKSSGGSEKLALVLGDIVKRLEALEAVKK